MPGIFFAALRARRAWLGATGFPDLITPYNLQRRSARAGFHHRVAPL
jgi:hypothetical protein